MATHATKLNTTSEAKLAANCANAKFSTGAKTEAGHVASSMNALRHGLTAKAALLPGDNGVEYQQFVASHVDRYDPIGDQENELVHLIAENAWRMHKIPSEEAAVYEMVAWKIPTFSQKSPIHSAALL